MNEAGDPIAAKESAHAIRDMREPAAPSFGQRAAWLLLCAVLLCAGLYLLGNYVRALVWALVLAIALSPLYDRLRRKTHAAWARRALPLGLTALVGLVIFIPFATLAVDAVREVRDLVEYGRSVEQSGLPVPDFVAKLPSGGQWIADWWREHLSHAGWAKEIAQQVNTSSTREIGASVGANAIHRVVLFGISLLALFFLLRHREDISSQCRAASEKMFGEKGERLALQMVASVHGAVNGLVLVAIGEGVLLGGVYYFTKLPHPILFGLATAVAAMIPFAAALVIALAALILLGGGGVGSAIAVVIAGFLVTFVADHFVRPKLIGGATQLPFLWVLLGILGGVENFQLLGLFLGPAIMAALMQLWRELTALPGDMATQGPHAQD